MLNTELVDVLLAPIGEGSPCGDDLEYDAAFMALGDAAIGKPEQQFGEFGAPSDAETAITKAVANQFIHYLPQLGPQAQAGSFGSTTTPNTGSNVTVNVNSGRCLFPWLSWPCCKPTRIQQTTIVGAEDSAEASLGTVISQRGQQLDVERKLTPDSNTDK